MKKVNGNGKLTEEQFVVKAIANLRDGGRLGIHVVYSGFNAAYRSQFGTEPQVATAKLAQAGTIVVRPCRGGAMIYLAGEAPEAKDKGADALAKILA